MEQVKSICQEDPELSILLHDHPLLIQALESIDDLTSEQIFSILTAVENEVLITQAYILTKQIEDVKCFMPGPNAGPESSAMEIEELKSILLHEQDYNQTLNKVLSIQQIIKLSDSFNDVASSIKQRNFTQTAKLVSTARLEKENKDLQDQILTLPEQLQFLTTELKSNSDIHGSSFGNLEQRVQEIRAETNSVPKPKSLPVVFHKSQTPNHPPGLKLSKQAYPSIFRYQTKSVLADPWGFH